MTNNFQGFLDNSFDSTFDDMNLPWLPWVGSRYRETDKKTIVLGESIYVYGAGDEQTRQRILKRDSLRKRQMTHGILAEYKSRYLRNFERAVFMKKRPSSSERTDLWSKVIYHNLSPNLLPSKNDRPKNSDYTAGWEIFLELAQEVQAQQCIVYGLEWRKVEALLSLLAPRDVFIKKRTLSAIGHSRPLLLSILLSTGPLDLLFIRHPSAFFSWKKWGTAIKETGMTPIEVK
ncbi:hypothetical protein [Marinobacter salarius]|uniref:hypothetical protein n=1 Tax=Marinobacter salarius TaxID=1420917 RepID=UPI000F859EDF|nr:hypothetical protein [Marinobacter salarius]AZR42997.1 hypothetical protein MTMN5_03564 [Marinobacter salarius]